MASELQKFIETISTDAVAQKRLVDAEDTKTFANVAVQLGAEKGFRFTIEEVLNSVQKFIVGSRELTEAELEAVAGAGGDPPSWPPPTSRMLCG